MQKQTVKKISGLALGSSMLLLSMIPAASAFAATAPAVTSVTLKSSVNGSATAGSTVTFTAQETQTGSGTPEFQFWTEAPNGTWTATGWSTNDTYTLPNVQTGSYEVVAYAKDKGQTTPVSSESTYSNQFVNVGTSLTFTTNAKDVAPLSPVTITATAKNFTNVVYQYWIGTPNGNGGYNWVANGDYTTSNTYTFTPPTSGNYQIAVYAKDLNAPQDWQFANSASAAQAVYGTAAGVKLSAASSTLQADGSATDTVTATVVDANGNPVLNYNGQITVVDSIGATGTSGYGLVNANGAFVGANTPTTFTVTNGQVQFQVGASSSASDVQTLTTSGLTNAPSGVNINYGSLSISQVAPAAASVGLQIASGDSSYLGANTQNSTYVQYALLDSAKQPAATLPGQYVTYTLSGPGSFSSSSVVTTETLWTDGTWSPTGIQVFSEPGQSGTITVTASGTGVSGSIAIPSYVNTSAASLSITSKNATGANGNPYTLYTVQLLDTNGHPLYNNTDPITVTNNAVAPAGIEYGTINAAGSFVAGTAPTSLTDGQAQFAVRTTTAGTAPVTISVEDTTNSLKANATYNYAVNAPTTVTVTPSSTSTNYNVEAGQSVTYTAQLVDSNNNPVAEAGQQVTFSLTTDGVGATLPNGLGLNGTYVATTNSQGVASVTVNVPSTAAATTGAIVVNAAYNGNTVTGGTTNVVGAAGYATQVSVTGAQTSYAAGANITGITALVQNAVNTALGGDTLWVTTSNPNVVAVNGTNNGPDGEHVTAVSTGTNLPNLVAGMAGSATITVQDVSDPAMPKTTFTVNVLPGQATQTVFELNGKEVGTTANPLSVTANSPVELQVVNADAGGDPVLVAGSSPLSVALNDANGGSFRLTPNGANVTSVEIPAGQSSTTVYYVSPTTNAAITTGLNAFADGIPASVTQTTAYSAPVAAANSTATITYGTPTATSGSGSTPASVTIGSTTYTYNSAPTGNEFDTEASLVSAINANTSTTSVTASSSGSTITLTDATGSNTEPLSSNDATNLGVSGATFSGGTTAVPGTAQVYTLSVTGVATYSSTEYVTVSDGTINQTVSVSTTAGESAAAIATAIASALSANTTISGAYTIGNATAGQVTLTQKTASNASISVTVY